MRIRRPTMPVELARADRFAFRCRLTTELSSKFCSSPGVTVSMQVLSDSLHRFRAACRRSD